MKISERFADYGLIGGFFWLLVALCAAFTSPTPVSSHAVLAGVGNVLNQLPKEAISPVAALLGALALISVFATGLMLDLFGAYFFRATEASVLGKYLRENEEWLANVVDYNHPYFKRGWVALIRMLPALSFSTLIRRRDKTPLPPHEARALAYGQTFSFLIANLLLGTGKEQIEYISAQLAFWSTSRAIAIALYLNGIVFALMGVRRPSFPPDWTLVVFMVEMMLFIAGAVIARAAHRRVCENIFALLYVIRSKALTDHA